MGEPTFSKSMRDRVLIFIDGETSDELWSKSGQLVWQLPQLYQAVKERQVDLIIVDRKRHELTSAVASRIRRKNPLTEIWRVTSGSDMAPDQIDSAFIDGVLSKPVDSADVEQKINHILAGQDLLAKYGMVGRSQRIKAVAETVERIAPTDISVLVVGASGTGKELVALAIHSDSSRNNGPFVAINCGALAEGVLESELFGHEKGAFTGSVGRREGLFHKANDGTILLDEIGELKPETQVKLLRVLEDGTYYPVGSSTPAYTNARIISATNRDLAQSIAEREFREDLYFRIGVVKIVLPPLIDRRGDIYPLLCHFWSNSQRADISDSALDLLQRYDWPGNVRQLRNFADRTIALKGEKLIELADVEQFIEEQHATTSHLPVSTGKTVEEAGQELIYRSILSLGNEVRMLRDLITSHLPGDVGEAQVADIDIGEDGNSPSMEEMEQELIRRVLTDSKGNRKEAASKLGIGERTLYRKLKKYGLH